MKYTYSGNDLGFDYVDRSGYENTVGHSQVSAGETQLVTEGGEMPHQRRTFKQLKDSVMVKKDALWQEACDDGTQEYILLDQAFNKDPRQTQRIYDRSLVEGDPKNFVEVFKVSPDYMTREELDQFEAFKKGKTAKAAVVKTEATEFPPSKSTVSNARLEKFVAAWNSSRNLDSLATKLGISIGTVYVYKSAAQRQGKELKTLRRSKKAA
ncbi:hypothetical protein MPC38_06650 [Prescottella equi]|uniref:hypothetical protein n=1 Tax=Rhodococcus hoagii TaxID=43767 RepID=UPI001F5B276E|nr:hypothetical protein [Prescottella equi]UNQ40924.1 hypothetical protein MPC38_06650 [Prescottella equi]